MNIKKLATQNLLARYIKESYAELKKVVWPSKQQTIKDTIIVIAISLGIALFLGGSDYILTILVEKIFNR